MLQRKGTESSSTPDLQSVTRESVCTRPGPTPPKHPQHEVAVSDYEGVAVNRP